MEKRGGALIDIDRLKLEERMKNYFDPKIDWATLEVQGNGLTKNAAGFNAETARRKILAAGLFKQTELLAMLCVLLITAGVIIAELTLCGIGQDQLYGRNIVSKTAF